ncbi:hypothetical protein F8O01_06530 [Pseudoclavibacter chungangensis]|uniref:Uncharacterized protein n=1 Tax=Pseudoclavibacter chungangensis TaxID=587635 RepID=A0A7J5BUH0_9MICO|nr:hypothetical protein [Pseudoclavibacter chungangensis]KAB1657928.1 hypothetical protein F8O01_06530 [Pseudoclavibacter chungangensis]NYJ65923.1 C4-dicarboxylate-specific signal transduction histidine kinase [Pseudoclavibacter chungangensis]
MSASLALLGELVLQVPTPTDPPFDPDDVTPGVVGFAAIFVLFLMVSAIAFDLIRRVRRVKYREVVREKLEREVAERDANAARDDEPSADGGGVTGAREATDPPGSGGDQAR